MVVSYTVTFYDSNLKPVTETVTPSFPTDSNGNAAYAGPGDDWDYANQSYELWPMIMEKAYAQWYGGYGDIEGEWPSVSLRQLTGKSADEHGRDWSMNWYFMVPVYESVLAWVTKMSAAFDAKKAVCVNTIDKGGKKPILASTTTNKTEVRGDHAYVLKKVNLNGKDTTIELYNPWGSKHPILTLTEFESCVNNYSCLDEGLT